MNNQEISNSKEQIRILKIRYTKLTKAAMTSEMNIAPIYAQRLAYLNNIKELQMQIQQNPNNTEQEIAKIHEQMRNSGLGWILDNLPKKK